MLRDYTLLIRLFMVTVVPIVCIILLIISRKERKLQILTLTAGVTIFFFMFFFGIYVRVPNIKEDNAEKIWDTLSALEFGEQRPDYELSGSEIKNFVTYKEEGDKYTVSVEMWNTDDEFALNYWFSMGKNLPNGMRLIYDFLITGGEENEYAWKISPLSADRVQEGIYAFTGYYNGRFIIKKGNQYIRCDYSLKTSQGNLSAFMCVPPIGFDLEELIMQFA